MPTPEYRASQPAANCFPLLSRIDLPADRRWLSEDPLPELADELRGVLIDNVSRTGGHLASGLGVVDLTVILHYVFDTPNDRLIWQDSPNVARVHTTPPAWGIRVHPSVPPLARTKGKSLETIAVTGALLWAPVWPSRPATTPGPWN